MLTGYVPGTTLLAVDLAAIVCAGFIILSFILVTLWDLFRGSTDNKVDDSDKNTKTDTDKDHTLIAECDNGDFT